MLDAKKVFLKNGFVIAMLCFLPRISCCLACVEPNKLKVSWAPRFLYSLIRPRPAQPLHTSAVSLGHKGKLAPSLISQCSVQFVEPSPATGGWSVVCTGCWGRLQTQQVSKANSTQEVLSHSTKNNFYSSITNEKIIK